LNFSNYREKQLEIISTLLKDADTALLVGDFNFDSDINFSQHLEKCQIADANQRDPVEVDNPPLNNEILENESIAKSFGDYNDVWQLLRPSEKGYTFDSVKNTMLQNYEQMRYDRVLFRTKENFWKPTEIHLLGTEKIEYMEEPVFPSDHFGLELHLKLSNKH